MSQPDVVAHRVHPQLQHTNHCCVQAAFATAISHFDASIDTRDILADCPVARDDNGMEVGTLFHSVANTLLSLGFSVTIVTPESQLLDLSWSSLDRRHLLQRLRAAIEHYRSPALGEAFSRKFIEEYVTFVDRGGELIITPWLSAQHVREYVAVAPVVVGVSYPTLTGLGHATFKGLRTLVGDDVRGEVFTHAITVSGYDGRIFEVHDPLSAKPLRIKDERLMAAIHAASYAHDAALIAIRPRSSSKSISSVQ